jgi:hypothetical protein
MYRAKRGCSLAGRALPLHGRGQGFESPHLHQESKPEAYLHLSMKKTRLYMQVGR